MLMKKIVILFVVLLFFISCFDDKKNEISTPKNEINKAIEEEKTSFGRYSSSRYKDIVDRIYFTLFEKDKNLQNEDEKIKNISNYFYNYENNVKQFLRYPEEYYETAFNKTKLIKDSVLKNEIKNIILQSELKYKKQISIIKAFIKNIFRS